MRSVAGTVVVVAAAALAVVVAAPASSVDVCTIAAALLVVHRGCLARHRRVHCGQASAVVAAVIAFACG